MPLAKLARRAQFAAKTVSAIGLKRIALRIRYELAHRSGWLERRYPPSELTRWLPTSAQCRQLRQHAVDKGLFFAIDRPRLLSEYPRLFPDIRARLLGDADRIVAGEMEYFSHHWARFEPAGGWFRNPFTGQQVDSQSHWTHTAWDAPESGDLKFQLEPARFGWVYKLVRAYWYTRDEQYASAFWRLIDSWSAQNPPQAGPLWICGQESALRLLAMVFGLYGLESSAETTDERFARLTGMIAAHADRVLGTTVYARSQQNNHALSEGAGLLTAGLLLTAYPAAPTWRRIGRALLEEQVPLQVYQDGAYTQHSHNYHRVMLNVLTWAVRIGEQHGERLSARIYERLNQAASFLRQMLDPETGLAPNYGHNDGALILPLSVAPYGDLRPAVQAAAYAATQRLPLNAGDWNEDLLWLAGISVAERAQSREASPAQPMQSTPTEIESSQFATGGYCVLRGRQSWAMIRAAHYHDRPGQADQLHLDVWWRGVNVACDAGTYLYNGAPPWQNALAATEVHNTVTVDGHDQMTRGGRFLWLDWAQATRDVVRSPHAQLELFRGSHDGYQRLDPQLAHRREVLRIGESHWLVSDYLHGRATHRCRLHWLCPAFPFEWDDAAAQLLLETPAGPYAIRLGQIGGTAGSSLVVGDPHSIRGWRSRYYGDREPAISVALQTQANPTWFWTLLGPAGAQIDVTEQGVALITPTGRGDVTWSDGRIQAASWSGQQVDKLAVCPWP